MQKESASPAPTPIPIPDDFPVIWLDPEDAALTWNQEGTHFPESMPPLEFDFWNCAIHGIYDLQERFSAPHRLVIRYFNTYFYMGDRLVVAEEEKKHSEEQSQEQILELAGQMHLLWPRQWWPEIQEHLAFWDAFDLESASLEALKRHLDETWERVQQIWRLHFAMGPPAYKAMEKFKEFYGELFEEEGNALAAYSLLQGLENKTLEMGHALWDLSRRMAPGVAEIVAQRESSEVVAALGASEEGRAFLAEFQAYLHEYGQRSNHWSLSLPDWIQDPAPVVETLKSYLATECDPRVEFEKLAAACERSLGDVRERLSGYPQPVRDEFEERLQQARLGMVLSEDHNFWIDFNSTYKVRRVVMQLGRRFTEANFIEQAADVFYLHFDEVRQVDTDQRALVARRRAIFEHFRAIKPPPRLGVEPPPKEEDEEKKHDKPVDGDGVLRGEAVSPGKVRGPARVMETVASAERLQPGDIMVAQTTSSSWSPLFAILGGVITEVGGALSHCAVVAREYGLPAVVGVEAAREKITDGQIVELDAAEGLVRLVGEGG
ncbi:MAG: PEP-utilizing enzyme [Candidatus Latescibacterota bacterium]|nr:PEP-utilizing enzyme [Candidatus Latescibacterota bacterium]